MNVAALRNVLIILGLAAVIAFVPGGGTAGSVVTTLLSVTFLATLAWFATVFYRQNRIALLSLEPRLRLLLYGSIAVGALTAIATRRLWDDGGVGVLLWFALIGAAVFGIATVYRVYREI
ncbi:MAG: hypothetical protein ACR2K9_04265 [Solirubrobacteraceae bacterium]